MILRSLCTAAFAGLLASAPAQAQVTYNGWDLGPDYGSMLDELLQKDEQLRQQLAAYEREVTEKAMADPLCKAIYERQGGSGLDYPQFAYLCWATRYFTPDGIAYFQQTERNNWNKERLAVIDLRRMEAIRGEAQNDLNATVQNNNVEFGSVLVDKNTYIDPYSGATVELPTFSEPNQNHWDPATQAYYTMDGMGQIMKWQNGAWQVIQRQPRPGQQ